MCRPSPPVCHYCPEAPALDLHQPTEPDPYRLLGVCPQCGRWYLHLCPPPAARRRGMHQVTAVLSAVLTLAQLGLEPPTVPSEEEALDWSEATGAGPSGAVSG